MDGCCKSIQGVGGSEDVEKMSRRKTERDWLGALRYAAITWSKKGHYKADSLFNFL